jgi:hypothetical protein
VNENRIVTLHDISGDAILVNMDSIRYVRQAENYCVIYMSDNITVKVSETLNDIGKFVNAKKYIS